MQKVKCSKLLLLTSTPHAGLSINSARYIKFWSAAAKHVGMGKCIEIILTANLFISMAKALHCRRSLDA
jgi:hypothetical protein